MPKFIEVHGNLINIEDISKVEFFGDNVHLELFPQEDGKPACDYTFFTFARIHTVRDQKIEMYIDLHLPEEGESEEDWAKRNRGYIGQSMTALHEALGKIVRVTEFEYQD